MHSPVTPTVIFFSSNAFTSLSELTLQAPNNNTAPLTMLNNTFSSINPLHIRSKIKAPQNKRGAE